MKQRFFLFVVTLLLLTTAVTAQTIKGRVTNSKGESLPSVSVLIKGTNVGTFADLDGNFSITIPTEKQNAVLRFVFMGYTELEIPVGNKNEINAVLVDELSKLDEVVVVGYNTQKKADVTGAISSMKMSDNKNLALTSADQAMQGKMAGVTVVQNGGAPGANTQIRIRGLGTLNNNDPLYIIDGVPAAGMNDINPNDIERIDVLKDASSSAIYGSRAANGVVIIQTKRGRVSDKVNINFSTHAGIQTPVKKIKVLDAQGRNLIHKQTFVNDNTPIPAIYNDPERAITRTDWQDEVMDKSALIANTDFSVQGGSTTARYALMGSYFTNDGVLKGANFNRFNVRINTDVNLTKHLKLGENLMISRSNTSGLNTSSAFTGAYYSALMYMPDIPVYDANGALSGVGGWGADLQNPVGIIQRANNKTKNTRILGNAYLEWNIMEGLTAKTDFGYDWSTGNRKDFTPKVLESGRQNLVNELDHYIEERAHWTSTSTLKYNTQINKHQIMVLGGMSFENDDWQNLGGRKTDFESESAHAQYIEAGNNVYNFTGGRKDWSMMSYFGRLEYAFNNKYLLSATVRADGSSKFSKQNRWGYFPSLSAGWKVSEEAFFTPLKHIVNEFKIRSNWGQLGNQNINDNYPTYSSITSTINDDGYYTVFGEGQKPSFGRYESTIANPNIKWETTTQWGVGADFAFLNNKLEASVDWFNKETDNILVQVPISGLTGIAILPYRNLGKTSNKGMEFIVSYRGNISDFNFKVSGNMAIVKNKVVAIDGGSAHIVGESYKGAQITRTSVDQPMNYMWVLKTNGLFQSDQEVLDYKNSEGRVIQPSARAGDIRFVDTNNDGAINDKDRQNLGKGFPTITYGLNLSGDYKGFDLNLFFQGAADVQTYNATKNTGLFVDPQFNQFDEIRNHWSPENTSATIPRLSKTDPNSNKQMSDFYIENGSYLRLKALTLGYTFNTNWLKKIGVEQFRIYTTGQNLLTFTNYKGVDPELGQSGIDVGNFPQSRTFLFGVNLNF